MQLKCLKRCCLNDKKCNEPAPNLPHSCLNECTGKKAETLMSEIALTPMDYAERKFQMHMLSGTYQADELLTLEDGAELDYISGL